MPDITAHDKSARKGFPAICQPHSSLQCQRPHNDSRWHSHGLHFDHAVFHGVEKSEWKTLGYSTVKMAAGLGVRLIKIRQAFDVSEKMLEEMAAQSRFQSFVEAVALDEIALRVIENLDLHFTASRISSFATSQSMYLAVPAAACLSRSSKTCCCHCGTGSPAAA
jgi:hypothetical protein